MDVLDKFTAGVVGKVKGDDSLWEARQWKGQLSFDWEKDKGAVELDAEAVTPLQAAHDAWKEIHWAPRFLVVTGAKMAVKSACGPAGTAWAAYDAVRLVKVVADAANSVKKAARPGFSGNISAKRTAKGGYLAEITLSPSASFEIWKLKSTSAGCELALSVVFVGTLIIKLEVDANRKIVRAKYPQAFLEGELKISLDVGGLEKADVEVLLDVAKGNKTAKGSTATRLSKLVAESALPELKPYTGPGGPDAGAGTGTGSLTAAATNCIPHLRVNHVASAEKTMHTAVHLVGTNVVSAAGGVIVDKLSASAVDVALHHVGEKVTTNLFEHFSEHATEELLELAMTRDVAWQGAQALFWRFQCRPRMVEVVQTSHPNASDNSAYCAGMLALSTLGETPNLVEISLTCDRGNTTIPDRRRLRAREEHRGYVWSTRSMSSRRRVSFPPWLLWCFLVDTAIQRRDGSYSATSLEANEHLHHPWRLPAPATHRTSPNITSASRHPSPRSPSTTHTLAGLASLATIMIESRAHPLVQPAPSSRAQEAYRRCRSSAMDVLYDACAGCEPGVGGTGSPEDDKAASGPATSASSRAGSTLRGGVTLVYGPSHPVLHAWK
uniref:Uncharacterized protein n=1 Tax=Mycena chlorophos TaxID=658473 RepID=A0ABQ0LAC9_MYCCL|nr:predicted protein [Mycena chlorophos]